MKNKAGFGLIITIILIAVFTLGFILLLPKTSATIGNKVSALDDKISEEHIVDNYKAEYIKLTKKKKELQQAIIDFNVNIKTHEKKYEEAKKFLDEYKKFMQKSYDDNDVAKFNVANIQYKSQEQKTEVIKKMLEGYRVALGNLEKALSKIDSTLSKIKSNIDTVANKKLLVDSFKKINNSLESLKGIGDVDSVVNLEKLDEDFIRENVKMEVLDNDTTPDSKTDIKSKEDMKAVLDSLK